MCILLLLSFGLGAAWWYDSPMTYAIVSTLLVTPLFGFAIASLRDLKDQFPDDVLYDDEL